MNLADIMIIVVVLLIIGVAVLYIRKEKKQGKCVGCPYAKECAAKKAAGEAACRSQSGKRP
ncbi:MAG: FeoB-associated Cys-rich membrane protein [Lachnospiraceae bacterium]|nr:FeoB-associated Cys-rich membrane protein [Lachnospiraceae bacterium]MBP3611163.1 FeoB-associated Cys-rich membrane protein [Lachnospiraceae bacterium]